MFPFDDPDTAFDAEFPDDHWDGMTAQEFYQSPGFREWQAENARKLEESRAELTRVLEYEPSF